MNPSLLVEGDEQRNRDMLTSPESSLPTPILLNEDDENDRVPEELLKKLGKISCFLSRLNVTNTLRWLIVKKIQPKEHSKV